MLNYNENKVRSVEAQLLMAAGFPRDATELSFNSKLARFDMLIRLNAGVKTNTLHITLNFSRKETLDNELLCSIAADYMERIGFGGQPYLVYRHYDAAHPHVHIATVNVDAAGNRIETHNIGRNQSEVARKAIEEDYGLIKAEDQKNETAYHLPPARLDRAAVGKRATKSELSRIILEVTGSYRFTSLPELNAVLGQFCVWANPGQEGSRLREKNGLLYQLLDSRGDPSGTPIKASAFYNTPTLKNLQKRYTQNETERKPYGQRLKHLLDRAMSKAADGPAFTAALRSQGIRILLRENIQGQVYGVTFIDNATRSVFNGSDLGKQYGAKALMERLLAKGLWPLQEEITTGKRARPPDLISRI